MLYGAVQRVKTRKGSLLRKPIVPAGFPDQEATFVKTVVSRISRFPAVVVKKSPSSAAAHGPAVDVSTSAKLAD